MPAKPRPEIAAVFDAAPARARRRLKQLRAIVYEAGATQDVGAIEETLKWGEPAYRCAGGSTVRLAWSPKAPDEVAMHFICTTTLIERFRELYPRALNFRGNRSLVFALDEAIPHKQVAHCVALALTYHRAKRRAAS